MYILVFLTPFGLLEDLFTTIGLGTLDQDGGPKHSRAGDKVGGESHDLVEVDWLVAMILFFSIWKVHYSDIDYF